jgi:hypothetical protein
MSTIDYRTQLRTQQASLPTQTGNATYGPARGTRYGELYTAPVLQPRWVHALEGTYFVAHNTTNDASTTLAGHAAPVLADADATLTKPYIFIRNPSSTADNYQIMLDFIEIEVVTAGANGTQACWAAQVDTGTTRYSSGGTALTIDNPTVASSNTSVLSTASNSLLGGDVVSGAESAGVRRIGHGTLRPTIEIAGDKKVFIFGGVPTLGSDGAAAAKRESVVNMPPVVLGPTDQFLLALHGQASQNTAGVYKVRMGWVERAG